MPEMSPLGVFFRGKGMFVFLLGEGGNIIFSGKNKYHLSSYYKKDHVQMQISWKDHLSRTLEENIIFAGIFLRNIIFPFLPEE